MSHVLSAPSLARFLTVQRWDRYTAEDDAVWRTLYTRRMQALESTASRVFLDGAATIGLEPARIPVLDDVNRRLTAITGWSAVPVTGFLPAREFFACLAERRFPTTVTIRTRDELEYTPAPDVFHDVFGHVPLHADPVFADFLQVFGALAATAPEEAVEGLARLFWFTVEFGLVREQGTVKLYGSGLMSSPGEGVHALSDACEHRPFDLDTVLAQSFQIDHMQPVLFVVESFDALFAAVEELRGRFAR